MPRNIDRQDRSSGHLLLLWINKPPPLCIGRIFVVSFLTRSISRWQNVLFIGKQAIDLEEDFRRCLYTNRGPAEDEDINVVH